MAIITFGATIRAHTAIGILNNTSSNIEVSFLRALIPAGTTKFITFEYIDNVFRYNPRQSNLYTINSDGKTPFLDDVELFASDIVAGNVIVYSTTQAASSITYTAGASAVFTTYGDGSVVFN